MGRVAGGMLCGIQFGIGSSGRRKSWLCIYHWQTLGFCSTFRAYVSQFALCAAPATQSVGQLDLSAALKNDKWITPQEFHALCRLLIPLLLPSPLEDPDKDVYAEHKRLILRDGAWHEINADLEAGSSTAALHIEQHFLGEVGEVRLPRIGELGITKLRCYWEAGYSQGLVYLRARDGGMLCCGANLVAVTHVQEWGWEGDVEGHTEGDWQWCVLNRG